MTEAVLEQINATVEAQLGSIEVKKVIDPQYDLHDLLVFDQNEIGFDVNDHKKMKELARDNAQLIVNQIFGEAELEKKGSKNKKNMTLRIFFSCSFKRVKIILFKS